MRHAVIMAGGSGTRLWPLSRRTRPKQLLPLIQGRSLLQVSYERLTPLFPVERIWVITGADHLEAVAEQLPQVPRENLIGEPMGRDTANAIGLAANLLKLRDPDATMVVSTADHLITPVEAFQFAIDRGLDAAEANPEALVTYGITPTEPHTGYGYIQLGDAAGDGVYKVAAFHEKPDCNTAQAYLDHGNYRWNSGLFTWRVNTVLSEIERRLPDNAPGLASLAGDWTRIAGTADAGARFEALPKISIDFGVMEKAENVLAVSMPCTWVDVGSWTSLASVESPDAAGNHVTATRSLVHDAKDNIIFSEGGHLVAVLGVKDLVVVHTGNATLVCPRDRVQDIKALVDTCREIHGDEHV